MNELAVLIPTLNRAEQLPAIVRDLIANTTADFHAYFITELHDLASQEAVRGLPCTTVISGDYGSCAAAYNAGFKLSVEPYVFLSNDDVEHIHHWDEAALAKVKEGFPIVGVNEGHDRMTCFSMVERAYIQEHSGVFDKPSTLVHEYASQYVDTELADYAKARGVWAEAPEGGVIHRHWEWGEADRNHPNYLKVQSTLAEDERTYRERKPLWEEAARCATA